MTNLYENQVSTLQVSLSGQNVLVFIAIFKWSCPMPMMNGLLSNNKLNMVGVC